MRTEWERRTREKERKKQYPSSTSKIVVLWIEDLCVCTVQWLQLWISCMYVSVCSVCVYIFAKTASMYRWSSTPGLFVSLLHSFRWASTCVYVILFQYISHMTSNIVYMWFSVTFSVNAFVCCCWQQFSVAKKCLMTSLEFLKQSKYTSNAKGIVSVKRHKIETKINENGKFSSICGFYTAKWISSKCRT